MDNKKKASKGLIILAITLSIVLLTVCGIVTGLYFDGKYSANEKNIENIPLLQEVETGESFDGKVGTLSKDGIKKEETEDREIILDEEVNVTSCDIPQNNPDNYELNTPSYIISKYLECWENQDWLTMIEYTQKSWATKHDDSKERLESQYSFKELLGAQIIDEEKQGENLTKVTYKVWYKALDGENQIKITVANVIREEGEWGVNPISALREKEI